MRLMISGWVVRSFALCPLEFLQSRLTPNCRNFLKISGKFPAAASITLLFPQLSMSSQCTPALRRSCTIWRFPLKQAQCKGLGLISLVEPMTTALNSGFTYRYCCAAPLAIINLTIFDCPMQQAQIKAVHLFLLFSKWIWGYLSNWDQLFSLCIFRLIRTLLSWRRRLVSRWGLFCFCQSFILPILLLILPRLSLPLPIS